MAMSRKNLILYLNHIVQLVFKNKISIQTAMSEIMMLPSKLNCAFLLLSIHNTEDSSNIIYGRQRFINKTRDILTDTNQVEDWPEAKNDLMNVSQNLDPFVSTDGNKISKLDFKAFVWDLSLDINNPAQSDYDLKASNKKVYTNGTTKQSDPNLSADSDKELLTKIAEARKSQDKHWGRINHLTHRI